MSIHAERLGIFVAKALFWRVEMLHVIPSCGLECLGNLRPRSPCRQLRGDRTFHLLKAPFVILSNFSARWHDHLISHSEQKFNLATAYRQKVFPMWQEGGQFVSLPGRAEHWGLPLRDVELRKLKKSVLRPRWSPWHTRGARRLSLVAGFIEQTVSIRAPARGATLEL